MSATASPSIMIPHVFENITDDMIIDVLELDCEFGEVASVDNASYNTDDRGCTFRTVFVHFKSWNTEKQSVASALDVISTKGRFVKVFYEEGKAWFWKVFKYVPKNKASAPKTKVVLSGPKTTKVSVPGKIMIRSKVTGSVSYAGAAATSPSDDMVSESDFPTLTTKKGHKKLKPVAKNPVSPPVAPQVHPGHVDALLFQIQDLTNKLAYAEKTLERAGLQSLIAW